MYYRDVIGSCKFRHCELAESDARTSGALVEAATRVASRSPHVSQMRTKNKTYKII